MSRGIEFYKNQRDYNEPEIIDTFKSQGLTVKTLNKPCDLCVGLPWLTALVEVKNGRKRTLTPTQKDFIASHKGPYYVVYTTEDAEKLAVFLKRKSQLLTKHLGECKMHKPLTESDIEKEIQEKGVTAPRLTPDLIDSKIKSEDYHVFEGALTVCCLTLANGFTVTGESACASPENFNAELGKKIAKDNARNKIWQLEGYLLKESLRGS